MKKIIALAFLLFAVGCTNTQSNKEETKLINASDVYYQNNSAYNVYNDKVVNGTVLENGYDSYIYTKYKKGKISNKKVINKDNQSLLSSITYDENGLVTGNIIKNESGNKSSLNYTSGIKNGSVKILDNDEIYIDGTFVYGILNGSYTYRDYYTSEQNKITFYKGFSNNSSGHLDYENHLSSKTKLNMDKLNIQEDKAYYNNSLFTGLGYLSNSNGFIIKANYYDKGTLSEVYILDEVGTLVEFDKYFDKEKSLIINYSSYEELAGSVSYYNYYTNEDYDGKYALYYDDGRSFISNYSNNILDGEGIYYDKNGKITEVQNYTKNGYSTIAYYDYDTKKIHVKGQGKKVDDLWIKTGTWTYYNENGTLNEVVKYDDNKGWSIIYDENGNKFMEGALDINTNMYVGEIVEYTSDGKISVIYNYKAGKLDGKTTYYDKDSKIIKLDIYKDGILSNK